MTVTHVLSDAIVSVGDIDTATFLNMLTNGGPAGYGPFQAFIDGDYQYDNAVFREVLTAAGPDRPRIQNLKLAVDVPDVIDRGTAVIDSTGTLTVTFARTFITTPQVAIGSEVVDDDVLVKITSKTNTSFTITAKHTSTGDPATATVGWIAHGY
jgi:hypothetical protein